MKIKRFSILTVISAVVLSLGISLFSQQDTYAAASCFKHTNGYQAGTYTPAPEYSTRQDCDAHESEGYKWLDGTSTVNNGGFSLETTYLICKLSDGTEAAVTSETQCSNYSNPNKPGVIGREIVKEETITVDNNGATATVTAAGDYQYTNHDEWQQCVDNYNNMTPQQKRAMTADGSTPTQEDACGKEPAATTSTTTNADGGATDACFSGAGTLGWVLCPIIDALHYTLSWAYGEIVVPMLQIDSRLIDDSDNGTLRAWEIFRNIANIVFIILFLIVIFSQLTGFGIDNYGVKKVLPRLVVIAILVNISYFICQLAVDLSNILGASLNNFLVNLAPTVNHVTSPASAPGAFVAVALGGVGVVGAVAGAASLAAGGAVAFILTIFASLIGAVLSVLLMFALLVVRKAAVVILVAISPAAIVLYTLPNTQSIAKKWFDMLKGFLIVYPVCGVLIGGSYLASCIIANAAGNDAIMNLAAMLMTVIPFFFAPTLIKSSIAGVSSITGKLASIGQTRVSKASAAADSTIKGSSTYKSAVDTHNVRRARRIMKRDGKLGIGKIGIMGTGRGNQRRKLAAMSTLQGDVMSADNLHKAAVAQYANNPDFIDKYQNDDGTWKEDDMERDLRDWSNDSSKLAANRAVYQSIVTHKAKTPGQASPLMNIIRGSNNKDALAAISETLARDTDAGQAVYGKDRTASAYIGNSQFYNNETFDHFAQTNADLGDAGQAKGMSNEEIGAMHKSTIQRMAQDPALANRLADFTQEQYDKMSKDRQDVMPQRYAVAGRPDLQYVFTPDGNGGWKDSTGMDVTQDIRNGRYDVVPRRTNS